FQSGQELGGRLKEGKWKLNGLSAFPNGDFLLTAEMGSHLETFILPWDHGDDTPGKPILVLNGTKEIKGLSIPKGTKLNLKRHPTLDTANGQIYLSVEIQGTKQSAVYSQIVVLPLDKDKLANGQIEVISEPLDPTPTVNVTTSDPATTVTSSPSTGTSDPSSASATQNLAQGLTLATMQRLLDSPISVTDQKILAQALARMWPNGSQGIEHNLGHLKLLDRPDFDLVRFQRDLERYGSLEWSGDDIPLITIQDAATAVVTSDIRTPVSIPTVDVEIVPVPAHLERKDLDVLVNPALKGKAKRVIFVVSPGKNRLKMMNELQTRAANKRHVKVIADDFNSFERSKEGVFDTLDLAQLDLLLTTIGVFRGSTSTRIRLWHGLVRKTDLNPHSRLRDAIFQLVKPGSTHLTLNFNRLTTIGHLTHRLFRRQA
ncbi:hypothetical protein BVX98_06765, partial [bacterium F11]